MGKPVLNIKIILVATSPNDIYIYDQTDYDALGIDPDYVKATVKIYTPTGLLYSPAFYNTPNLSSNVEPNNTFQYQNTSDIDNYLTSFLVDNKGCLINGKYKVMFNWYNGITGEKYEYTFEQTIKWSAPKVQIEQTSDCFCPKFRSTDLTDYDDSEEQDYEHKINYPAETDEEDIITGLLDYTDTRLANGTYVTEIKTTRDFNAAGSFYVRWQVTGRKSHKVDCKSICDIKCGMNTLYDKYKTACGKDKTEADRLFKLLNKATALYTLLYMNNGCGDTSKSDNFLAQLKDIIGDCDCGCTDCDDDIWVTGACGSSGTSEFDPSGVYNYIDSINQQITNNITDIQTAITNLENAISTIGNDSWFESLTTACLADFPTGGSEVEKRQYILDSICELQELLQVNPIARNDYSTITQDASVEKLVTANDFFTADAEVTITTAPLNGVAVVLGDDKTLKYTPNSGWTGTETIGYTLTDTNGNTSVANWIIIVNAVAPASCYSVVAAYNASLYSVGANLQVVIANQTAYGTNTPTQEDYLIEIRDELNNILYSYNISGSLADDPTIWTSPVPIASNWNNVRIVLTTSSENADGDTCGTQTYESDSPYSLNNVSVSIFDGVDIPECIGVEDGDSDPVIMQKFIDKVCTNDTLLENLTSSVSDLSGGLNTLEGEITVLSGSISPATDFSGTIEWKRVGSIVELNINVNMVGVYVNNAFYKLCDVPIDIQSSVGYFVPVLCHSGTVANHDHVTMNYVSGVTQIIQLSVASTSINTHYNFRFVYFV